MKKRDVKIGLLGLGFVGKGVVELLQKNQDLIEKRTGCTFEITKVLVRSIEKHKNGPIETTRLTTSIQDILKDPEIDVVIELMGGDEPAKTYILDALKSNKHVITANKEAISKYKTLFFKAAKTHGVDLYFEAAVGGSIPLIRALKVGYAANQIKQLMGILNGTTNYILTKMEEEKKEFTDVLQEAQKLGLAEADPTMDVSGADAAHKLVILAATAFKKDIQLQDLYYEGIQNISYKDIAYANDLGYKIKLIAKGEQGESQFSFTVFPLLLPKTHTLANVNNELNALFIKGNAMGEAMIAGKGAGGLPTASAVVSDLIDLSFSIDQPLSQRNLETILTPAKVAPIEALESAYYMRIHSKDEPGVLEKISHAFSKHHINIDKIIQKNHSLSEAEIVIVTHTTKEKNIQKLLKSLESLSQILQVKSRLRVLPYA